MHRRYSLVHSVLADVIVLVLTPLIVVVDAQARIAIMSDRDWNWEIYVMNADGQNQRNLTNHPNDDEDPAWYNPAFTVAPARKTPKIWGWLKQVDR